MNSLAKRFFRWPLIAIGVAAAVFGAARYRADSEGASDASFFLTAPVQTGAFIKEVVESGNVESSSNVEIRCEVDTGSAGLAILEIIPEGTYVEEGDFLIRLDDADLQKQLVIRQIDVNSSRAALAQAKADLEGAKLELQEYRSGTYREQEEQMESEEFVSRENLRRAEEYLSYSQKLSEKGYVSEVQLEADRFAVSKASKELEVAKTKLEVLRSYTREKMLTQLAANIETAQAKLSSAERAFNIDQEQLAEVEVQIEKCIIHAPTSGQVVYANKVSSSDEPLIEEGKFVRERQEIIRLPDPKRMQVLAEVNESRIDMIEEGMTVRIRIDALPDAELEGALVKITEYPLRSKNSYTAHIKNYGATILIDEPIEGLRPGMTAEVAILVESLESAIQVPVQAVVEREDRYFCVLNHGDVTAREIEIGSANAKYVVIEAGLSGAEEVVLSPETVIDTLALPDPSELAARKVVRQQKADLVAKRRAASPDNS